MRNWDIKACLRENPWRSKEQLEKLTEETRHMGCSASGVDPDPDNSSLTFLTVCAIVTKFGNRFLLASRFRISNHIQMY